MTDGLKRLLAEVRADREAIERHLDTLARTSLEHAPSEAELALAAWSLHHAYSAFEQILERVMRTVEGSVPAGPSSHREILALATLEIEGVRPPLVSRALRADLQELLHFRHFARHGYGAELDAARLRRVREVALTVRPALGAALDDLEAWLRALVGA